VIPGREINRQERQEREDLKVLKVSLRALGVLRGEKIFVIPGREINRQERQEREGFKGFSSRPWRASR
jgi:hypothetical protein